MPKTKSTKCCFPFLPPIVYPSAQNGFLALKPTGMQPPLFILLSSRTGWPHPSCHGDQPRPTANSHTVCTRWPGTDNLTAQLQCRRTFLGSARLAGVAAVPQTTPFLPFIANASLMYFQCRLGYKTATTERPSHDRCSGRTCHTHLLPEYLSLYK